MFFFVKLNSESELLILKSNFSKHWLALHCTKLSKLFQKLALLSVYANVAQWLKNFMYVHSGFKRNIGYFYYIALVTAEYLSYWSKHLKLLSSWPLFRKVYVFFRRKKTHFSKFQVNFAVCPTCFDNFL